MKKTKQVGLIFERINKDLNLEHKGKIVAIEPDTGEYFIENSVLEAYKKARKRFPNKKFVFKRIGFASTHFVGAL